jgi:hypothetical protein
MIPLSTPDTGTTLTSTGRVTVRESVMTGCFITAIALPATRGPARIGFDGCESYEYQLTI